MVLDVRALYNVAPPLWILVGHVCGSRIPPRPWKKAHDKEAHNKGSHGVGHSCGNIMGDSWIPGHFITTSQSVYFDIFGFVLLVIWIVL